MRVDTMKICIILAEKTMSKVDLSRKTGIMPQNITAILKKGTCEPKTAGKIACGLGVPVTEILVKED